MTVFCFLLVCCVLKSIVFDNIRINKFKFILYYNKNNIFNEKQKIKREKRIDIHKKYLN